MNEIAIQLYRQLKAIYACPYPDKETEIKECVAIITQALAEGIKQEVFLTKMKILRSNMGDKTPALARQIVMRFWLDDHRERNQPTLKLKPAFNPAQV